MFRKIIGPARLDRLELHLTEAPKNDADRQHRRNNDHLDASPGVDGIEAFYEQCVANGVTIIKRSRRPSGARRASMSRTRMATSSAWAATRPQANKRSHVVRVRNKLRRLSTLRYRKRIATPCGMWIACGTSALLATLEETEHFRRRPQQKVAKIVHCGEPRLLKAAGFSSGLLFAKASCVRNCKELIRSH